MEAAGTEDKIELLVRSVLEAVDARLDAVRGEIHALAADLNSRHLLVTTALADLERRVARQPAQSVPHGADSQRMEQATQMLLERIEAMHQRTTMATNDRFLQLRREIDLLRGSSGTVAPETPITSLGVTASAPVTVGGAIDFDHLFTLLSDRLGNLHLDPLPGFDPPQH